MAHQAEEPRRKGMSVRRLLFIAVIAFLLISVVLQKCGIKVMNQTEDSEMIDKPHRNR